MSIAKVKTAKRRERQKIATVVKTKLNSSIALGKREPIHDVLADGIPTVCLKCGKQHLTYDKVTPSCRAHKTKKRGENGELIPCGSPKMKGKEVCYYHGGPSLRGPAAPQWKHGLYAKGLPTRYQRAFKEALSDPELVSMRTQLALIDAREVELMQRLNTDEAGELWHQAKAEIESLKAAMKSGDKETTGDAIRTIMEIVERGATDEVQWQEFYQNAEMRRKISESERRRIEAAQAYVTPEEMGAVAAFLAGLLRRYIDDSHQLRKAANDMTAFFNQWQRGGSATPLPKSLPEGAIDAEVIES